MEERLGRRLALTTKLLQATMSARLAAEGGSLSTWIVLRHAARGDGELSQRALADKIVIDGATLVRHLDRLEAEGLIERRRDAVDRRVVRVSVTPTGQALYERLTRAADELEREITAVLSDEERRMLLDTLQRLQDRLDQLARDRDAGVDEEGVSRDAVAAP